MENRSRLPGERSLDHPGVPTGRGGHRAGLKTVGGIPRRFFCGLPALPRKCSDPGVGASSTGKHRSPQTAPRLQGPNHGPNIGSNKPGQVPGFMLDAFRASLTWSVELSGSVRSVSLSLFRGGAGASGVVLACRLLSLYDNFTIRASSGQVSYDLSPVAPPRSDMSAGMAGQLSAPSRWRHEASIWPLWPGTHRA